MDALVLTAPSCHSQAKSIIRLPGSSAWVQSWMSELYVKLEVCCRSMVGLKWNIFKLEQVEQAINSNLLVNSKGHEDLHLDPKDSTNYQNKRVMLPKICFGLGRLPHLAVMLACLLGLLWVEGLQRLLNGFCAEILASFWSASLEPEKRAEAFRCWKPEVSLCWMSSYLALAMLVGIIVLMFSMYIYIHNEYQFIIYSGYKLHIYLRIYNHIYIRTCLVTLPLISFKFCLRHEWPWPSRTPLTSAPMQPGWVRSVLELSWGWYFRKFRQRLESRNTWAFMMSCQLQTLLFDQGCNSWSTGRSLHGPEFCATQI